MKDALHRLLTPGDIVIVKKQSYGSNLTLGIVIGNSGVYLGGDKVINSYRDCYLIERPTEMELSIADELESKYKELREKAKEEKQVQKDAVKFIPLKDMKPGDYGHLDFADEYERRKIWVYLGKVDAYVNEVEFIDGNCVCPELIKSDYCAYTEITDGRRAGVVNQNLIENGVLKGIRLCGEVRLYKNKKKIIKDNITGHIELKDKYIGRLNWKERLFVLKGN